MSDDGAIDGDADRLIRSMQGQIEPVQATESYGAQVLLVALSMIALLLFYLGMIAAVAYFFVYIPTLALFDMKNAPFQRYVYQIMFGVCIVYILVRPIFLRRSQRSGTLLVTPTTQPGLYAYLRKLSGMVHAPMPKRVYLSMLPEAYAHYQWGLLGAITGRHQLTIGLPLILCMNVRELSGVVAHEMGHFSQRGGRLAHYMIASINRWLADVANYRDESTQSQANTGNVLVWPALAAQYITGYIFTALLYVAHAISCALMREFEYDADMHEIRLAGSRAFCTTFQKLLLLHQAMSQMNDVMQQAMADKKVPENISAMIVAGYERLTPETRDRALREVVATRAGRFDTHPSVAQRLAQAMSENEPGLQVPDSPASELIHQLPVTGVRVTREHFKAIKEFDLSKVTFVPTPAMTASDQLINETGTSLEKLFHRCIKTRHRLFPLPPKSNEVLTNADAPRLVEQLIEAIRRCKQTFPAAYYAATYFDLFDYIERIGAAGERMRDTARNNGVRIKPVFPVKPSDKINSVRRIELALAAMEPFEQAALERLDLAIRLYSLPVVRERVSVSSVADPVQTLAESLTLLQRLSRTFRLIDAITPTLDLLHVILTSGEQEQTMLALLNPLMPQIEDVEANLKLLREGAGKLRPPAAMRGMIADATARIIEEVPPALGVVAITEAGYQARDNVFNVYFRVLSFVAYVGMQVEKALGVPDVESLALQDAPWFRRWSLNDRPALTLAPRRLVRLDSGMFGPNIRWAWPKYWFDRTEAVEQCRALLANGMPSAAVVIQTSPKPLVAAYVEMLDGVIVQTFPEQLIAEHRLARGSRLLAVTHAWTESDGHGDLTPGPQAVPMVNGAHAIVADFLCDDPQAVATAKAQVPDAFWRRAAELGDQYVKSRGMAARPALPRGELSRNLAKVVA